MPLTTNELPWFRALYGLWLARNSARDGRRIEEASDTARSVVKLMEEWQSEKGGVGVVFRNHEGAFLGGACHFFPQSMEPAKIELQACRRAARLADEVNARLRIEMDCKDIVSKLQNKERDLSMLLETRQEWKLSWVRRTVGLAKEGVMNNLCKVWLNEPPECILHIFSMVNMFLSVQSHNLQFRRDGAARGGRGGCEPSGNGSSTMQRRNLRIP